MKILHLATDDKFIDYALPLFEAASPQSNSVFVYAGKTPLRFVGTDPERIVKKRPIHCLFRARLSSEVYRHFDLFVFHSLHDLLYSELANIPRHAPKIWLGWGFDYYEDFLDQPLYLPETRRLRQKAMRSGGPISKTYNLIRAGIERAFQRGRRRAVEEMTLFSPVVPSEYQRVKEGRNWRRFPTYCQWNYGTLEDSFIRKIDVDPPLGNAVLVGNSATYSNNHVEAFQLLTRATEASRRVIAPLSYGEPGVSKEIERIGRDLLGQRFKPLNEFLPIEKYLENIGQCGYAIMNHRRQQAVGNIVIMLYLGARVFVREESPVNSFLTKLGANFSTVQALEANPDLISLPLSDRERKRNKDVVASYWSRPAAMARTVRLLKKAASASAELRPPTGGPNP